MIPYLITLVLGLAAMIVFLRLRVKGRRVPAAIVKAVTSLFFILCACAAILCPCAAAGSADRTGFAPLIISGLACGLLGDIWLDLKFAYPSDDAVYTYAGFICFGVGHIFYIAAMLKYYTPGTLWIIIPAASAVLGFAGSFFGEKAMKMDYGRYKTITSLYVAVLFYVTTTALGCAVTHGFGPVPTMMFVGIIFFLISDFILSNTYFGKGWDKPAHIVLNHVTYYIAQFVIASSIIAVNC